MKLPYEAALCAQDMETLRALGGRYLEAATSPAQRETQQLWAALNNGRMQRPMVMIDQIPWHEMDVDGSLTCTIAHPYWRQVEQRLRQMLYQFVHMPVDMLLPPYILLPSVLTDPDYRALGIALTEHTAQTDSSNDVVSHDYVNQFETMADVEKIKLTALHTDKAAQAQILEQAQRIFGGIAPVRFQGVCLHSGLWDTIAMWMNVEECYYRLIDEPELLHAIMERATQAELQWIRQGNEDALFDTVSGICHCSGTLTQPFADAAPLPGTAQNSWTFGMAQLFSSVSPEVTAEFEVPYMQRIFQEFGNVYYGCCERLDDRLETVCTLPHLRKISCSPWSNREAFAEKLPRHIILSNKPNPALVGCGTFDAQAIRADLRRTLAAAKQNGLGLELLLKDNSSVQYEPQRLWEFGRIAMELVQSW